MRFVSMGGKELAVPNTNGLNLREVAARTTLREIHLQGHVYVELRQVGKRTIFFCILCQTPCFNDSVLNDHLKGNLHSRRYAAAKVTLFGPTPWPFSDGILFFNTSCENYTNGTEVISKFRGIGLTESNGCKKSSLCVKGQDKVSNQNGKGNCIVIPGVLRKDEVKSMRARLIGYGHIGARVQETNEGERNINKIWCAWLGEGGSEDCSELLSSPKSGFAIVSFSYTYDLGRKATLEESEASLSHGSFFEIDDHGCPKKKRRKSFSDPEDSSECRSEKMSDCGEESSGKLHTTRLISSKSIRRELRKQKCLAAERTCDICAQHMLLGKDVSTLLNCKTGRLACSSRNPNGAFHLFHTSCLVHWILLCEYETWSCQSKNVKATTRGRKAKLAQKNCISTLCPECQGTGIRIEGDDLEKPTIPLSEMFLHKLKVIEAQKMWMKNPEVLNRCSTGFYFSSDSSEELQVQENVMPLRLLQFYRADG